MPAGDAVESYLRSAPGLLGWERVEDAFWYVRIAGVNRRVIPIEVSVGEKSVLAMSNVLIEPEVNQAGVYRYVLQRNMAASGVAFASDRERSLCLIGRVPLEGFDESVLDGLLGRIVTATEETFQTLIRLGFDRRPA